VDDLIPAAMPSTTVISNCAFQVLIPSLVKTGFHFSSPRCAVGAMLMRRRVPAPIQQTKSKLGEQRLHYRTAVSGLEVIRIRICTITDSIEPSKLSPPKMGFHTSAGQVPEYRDCSVQKVHELRDVHQDT
jgi:hypothetical protein